MPQPLEYEVNLTGTTDPKSFTISATGNKCGSSNSFLHVIQYSTDFSFIVCADEELPSADSPLSPAPINPGSPAVSDLPSNLH